MISIQRQFTTNYKKTNLLTFLAFFGVMMMVGILTSLLPTELINRPVYEPWFGPYFGWYHLLAIGIFVFLIVFLTWLNKKSTSRHAMVFLMADEKKQFQLKYNQDKTLPVFRNTKLVLAVIVVVLVVDVLVQVPDLLNLDLSESMREWLLASLVSLTGFFYVRYLYRYLRQYNQHTQRIFEHVQQQVNQTQLQISESSIRNDDRPIGSKISGRFKGYEFEMDYYTFNPEAVRTYAQSRLRGGGGRLKIYTLSYKVAFKLKSNAKVDFEFLEKDEDWKLIEAPSIDEAFLNRFELKLGDVKKIPNSVKLRLLNFQRQMNLKVIGDQMTYTSKSVQIFPYFGPEGIILFLDFLSEIAQELE